MYVPLAMEVVLLIIIYKGEMGMFSISELKDNAKLALKNYFWKGVLVCFIAGLLGGGGATTSVTNYLSKANNSASSGGDYELALLLATLIMGFVAVAALLGFIYQIFVGNLITVGKNRFFINSRETEQSVGVIFHNFKQGRYLSSVLTMFLYRLFIGLWTLLFIIPGVIKTYEYYFMPYIIADQPDITYKDAFAISKEMTSGLKMDIFVLELSFIGWYILSVFTCGIGLLFISPYVEATRAELYICLKARRLGVTSNNVEDDFVKPQF